MGFNIVLIEPEIPNNTGNIGRLSLATGSTLHLVRPLGFDLDEKKVRRAGLDYWQHLNPKVYDSAESFFEKHSDRPMALFSSHGEQTIWSLNYEKNMFLIFGKESVGLSSEIINTHSDKVYTLPMYSTHIRSLNLANAVSAVVYEGLRRFC